MRILRNKKVPSPINQPTNQPTNQPILKRNATAACACYITAIEDDARRRERNSRLASALGVAPSVGGSVEGELQSLSRADVFIADSCITRFQTELRRHLFPIGLVSW